MQKFIDVFGLNFQEICLGVIFKIEFLILKAGSC